ncbi:hypothetical protein ABH924_003649 [Arthrobacter sp. GAS37]
MDGVTDSTPLGEALETAYAQLVRDYRVEYVYKNTIASTMVFGRHSPDTASAVLELAAGDSIADIVVLNGASTAYEIKTDLDQFSRLPQQVADYAKCFDKVIVVTSRAKAEAALDLVPSAHGVIGVDRRGRMRTYREPTVDETRLDPGLMFRMLRREEYLGILKRTIGFGVDPTEGDGWIEARTAFAALPPNVVRHEVLVELRRRGMAIAKVNPSIRRLPKSVRALAYSSKLSRVGFGRLLTRLNQPVSSLAGL